MGSDTFFSSTGTTACFILTLSHTYPKRVYSTTYMVYLVCSDPTQKQNKTNKKTSWFNRLNQIKSADLADKSIHITQILFGRIKGVSTI